MLQVKLIRQSDLDYKIHNLAYQHCLNVQLPDSVLARHYAPEKLAEYIVKEASKDFMFVLYDADEPIGIFILDTYYPVHLECMCFVSQLLFITESNRSLKNLRALVLQSISILKTYKCSVPMLIAVGNTVGSPILPCFYKRIGFIEAGTQLVLEL